MITVGFGAGVLALVLGTGTVSGTLAASDDVDNWFNAHAAQVVAQVSSDQDWAKDSGISTGTLTFGRPVPLYSIIVPRFDLQTGRVQGSTKLDDALAATNDWCARGRLDAKPIDLIACAEEQGASMIWTSVSDLRFQDWPGDLPVSGVLDTGAGYIGFEQSEVVALDSGTRTFLTKASLPDDDFLAAIAEQKAGYDAIARIDGAVTGGAIPLFDDGSPEYAAWAHEVSQGLAIPDDQAYSEANDNGMSDAADRTPGWVPLVVGFGLIVLVAALVVLTRRRPRI